MTTSDRFPNNRYTALEEVQELLSFGKLELLTFLEALAKADDGYLRYDFGNLQVAFTVNDGFPGCGTFPDEHETICKGNPRQTVVCISLAMEKGHVETSATYQFSLHELRGICRAKPLRIESFGDS